MSHFSKFPLIRWSLLIILLTASSVHAQAIRPSSAELLQKSAQERAALLEHSPLKTYPIRSVGPTVMGARVVDVEVRKNKPKEFFAAYASGGLFKTTNFGVTFEPIFDHQEVLGMGDFALSEADEHLIFVGTGENNSSRSSYAGNGIFKTEDGGKTWKHVGLRNSQHIGKIITHPTQRDVVWVASMGSLYSTNNERGIYKSTDGGATWKRTLYINDKTGGIDLIMHPENPNILWASMWERIRFAWDFVGNGEGSSIWKSTDGGETWTKTMNGFPTGKHVGRIGLSVSTTHPDVVYALLDNQEEVKTPVSPAADGEVRLASFESMSKEQVLALENRTLAQVLRQAGIPARYTPERVKEELESGKIKPVDIARYNGGDANSALFNTSVKGAEVYRSDDGGMNWKKMNERPIEGLYYTYGYYFGEIRVSTDTPDVIYVLGVPLLRSNDGGKTFERADQPNVHVDHQDLWINPQDADHLLSANDGGIYTSFDRGKTWTHHNSLAVGQFYTIMVDMDTPYNIYGGMQDNGVYWGSSISQPNANSNWRPILGGDGMHVAVNPEDSDVVYAGSQFGNYFKIGRAKGNRVSITPKHDIGTEPYRYNWNTPVIMSPHNPAIIYFGTQKVLRTTDGGKTWVEISGDLTSNHKPQGNVPYSTVTTISESPLKFGLIWAGTDDGNVWITRDAGNSWTKINGKLPAKRWVSKISASPFNEAEAFVSLTGYRYDEFETYVYRTTDYGKTWTSIKGNLPSEAANIILPDTEVPGLWFAGLDHGAYVTMDSGKQWHRFPKAFPNVATYDMIIHPREGELVLGTHGRSVWVMDIKPLRLVAKQQNTTVLAFKPANVRYNRNWGSKRFDFQEAVTPHVELMAWLQKADSQATINIKSKSGEEVASWSFNGSTGFNTLAWDLKKSNGSYVTAGVYSIVISAHGSSSTTTLDITTN